MSVYVDVSCLVDSNATVVNNMNVHCMVANCDHDGLLKAKELYKNDVVTKWVVISIPVNILVDAMLAMTHDNSFTYEYGI